MRETNRDTGSLRETTPRERELLQRALPAEEAPPPRAAYWDEIESPIGPLYIATGEDGRVRRVVFARSLESFLDDLLVHGWLPLRDREANAELIHQLEEFFACRRQHFDLPIDLTGMTPFTRAVLEACAEVPYGQWDTYGGIAARLGRPQAYRAVGNALGANPIPLVVPCHRILAAGGRIGGYGGGLEVKRRLLALEGTRVA